MSRYRLPGALLTLSLLSACVTPPKSVAPVVKQGERHNLKGLRAGGEKNYQKAAAEFAEAYRLYRSVEDYNGMVTALINSSRLHRSAGQSPLAAEATGQALLLVANTPQLAHEVWFEKAQLLLLQHDSASALLWGEKALAAARESDRPRMLNLLAEIERRQGEPLKAARLAEEAREQSRRHSDRREEANALRLLGNLELAAKRPKEAVSRFTAALVIDKELALNRKIAADLRALSSCHEQLGDEAAAAAFRRRAEAVETAAGPPGAVTPGPQLQQTGREEKP